jgi:hypothetical protein
VKKAEMSFSGSAPHAMALAAAGFFRLRALFLFRLSKSNRNLQRECRSFANCGCEQIPPLVGHTYAKREMKRRGNDGKMEMAKWMWGMVGDQGLEPWTSPV